MKENIDDVKKEISNLRFYEKEIKRIKEKIALIEYNETNVKGINYSKQPGSTNPAEISLHRLEMIEDIAVLEEEEKAFSTLAKRIRRWLNRMEKEEKELVEAVLVERKKYVDVAKEKNISSTSLLNYYIDRAIEKAIKKS